MERVKGIGPSQPAWKAGALPLSYTRKFCGIKKEYGAENEIRTRDPRLGKAMLYHWAISAYGGREWIWTTESLANGFTVRPL